MNLRATDNDPVSCAIDDFNGDGQPDLVAANHGSANVSVLMTNNGRIEVTVPLDKQGGYFRLHKP